MTDSAISARDRHRSDTTRTLIRAARRFTAEQGLSGFTVEQLCAEADVSRRTFFNYFASKEDAVLGVPLDRSGDADAVQAFLDERPDTPPGQVSATLLTDLGALIEARFRVVDVAPDTVSHLVAAVEREPRLLSRMLEMAAAGEREDAQLVARREGLEDGDLRADAAAQIVGAIARAAGGEFLGGDHPDGRAPEPFATIFARRMTAVRDLFTTQITPEETP
jgi:AcrR family transcriptional regulator